MSAPGVPARSALLYEPRTEGHHLVWLRFITEDLLSAGWRLVLAVDTRPGQLDLVKKRLGALFERVEVLPAWDDYGRRVGGQGAQAVADRLAQANARAAFLDTFDEIASSTLRRAGLGRLPPASLRGRMGGIYIRPRFLARRGLSANEWLKAFGFARLMRGGWFAQMLFLDPSIQRRCQARFPAVPCFFLPDPYPEDFAVDPVAARRQLGLPADKKVLLFYGGAYRRKGLHLAVEALAALAPEAPFFLLCAGQQPDDPDIQNGLQTLTRQGRAQVLSRYIFQEEERTLFAASDAVLLPYIKHFGNSAVLSRAAGAGKMVIASDEELIGELVGQYGLGPLFRSGSVPALRQAILRALNAGPAELDQWKAGAERYAAVCSRAQFRKTLLAAFDSPSVLCP